jgi:hypothetical protein
MSGRVKRSGEIDNKSKEMRKCDEWFDNELSKTNP